MEYFICASSCEDYLVGDGHCDSQCYTEECQLDLGDCADWDG